jgi:hypothetical protein
LNDNIDQDCDGIDAISEIATDMDADGFETTTDCDDTNATIYPGATELADGLDNDCDNDPDEGLVTITLDSLPATVVVGEAFSAQVTVTNNSGFSAFIVEARIHDTASSDSNAFKKGFAMTPLTRPQLLANFCTTATPCTTLASETLAVENAQSSTYTFTDLVTANASGTYYFVVRILLDGQELIYSRDYQALEVTPITE